MSALRPGGPRSHLGAGASPLRGVLYLYWSNLAYCSHSSGLLSYDSMSACTSSTLTLSSANIRWRMRTSSSRLRAFHVSVCTGCSILAGCSIAASRCPPAGPRRLPLCAGRHGGSLPPPRRAEGPGGGGRARGQPCPSPGAGPPTPAGGGRQSRLRGRASYRLPLPPLRPPVRPSVQPGAGQVSL